MKKLALLLFTLLAASALAATPNPGHDASRIGSGTFPAGDFAFNGSLSVMNGSNALFHVNHSIGTVLVGTATNRGGQLQVYTTNTTGSIRVGGSNDAGNHRIFIQANGDNSYIDSYGDGEHKKLTIEASQLLLNANGGPVGVNDTSPSYTLDVLGTIQAQGALITPQICLNGDCQTSWPAGASGSTAAGWTNTTVLVSLSDSGDNVSAGAFYIDNTNGRVGVGTNTPAVKMHVLSANGVTTQTVAGASGKINTFGYYDAAYGALMEAVDNGGTPINLSYRAASHLFYEGNVGIGTLNPGSKLDVQTSSTGLAGYFKQSGDGYGVAIESEGTSATRYALTVRNLAGTNTYFHVSTVTGQVGYVGIGTTNPSQNLEIQGGVARMEFEQTGAPARRWVMGTDTSPSGFFIEDATAGSRRLTIDTSGNFGINTMVPTVKLEVNGSAKINNVTVDPTAPNDGGVFFSLQPYIEGNIMPYGMSGSTPTTATFNTSAVPFSRVWNSTAHTEFAADYIPVQPGETLYGEMWAMRETGTSGGGLMYAGIARYDKDKKPIDGNLGLTYFVASGVNVSANSQWTKHSATTTLPLTHESFGGSDGGAVRYVRPYVIQNYPAGSQPTYWGGFVVRSVQQQRDNGTIAFNGNVGIGTTAPGQKLEVAGIVRSNGAATSSGFQLVNSGANSGGVFTESAWRGSGTLSNISITAYSGNAIKFFHNGGSTEAMTISTAGSVGIGTATPSSSFKLEVNGDTRLGSNGHAAGVGVMVDGVVNLAWGTGVPSPAAGVWSMWHESSDGTIRFKDSGGDTNLVIDDNGDVGIGTTDPQNRLHVSGGAIYADNPAGAIRVLGTAGTPGNNDLGIWERTNPDVYALADWDSGTKGIFINTANGAVSASHTLSVGTASGNDDDYIYIDGGAESIRWEEANTWFEFSDKIRVADEVQGTQFVDNDNTAYYVNPASTTNLNALVAGGTNNGAVIFYRDTNPVSTGNTDAVLYVSDRSGNDWGIISDKTGFDYGIRIDVTNAASYALAVHDGSTYTARITGGGAGVFAGALSSTTLDTGQGANELYDMNQNVQTTDAVTFADITSSDRFIMGVYPQSNTNAGEAWLFRAGDREDGTMTVQLGGNAATGTSFEIVDRAWTKVIAQISGEADAASFIVESSGDVHMNGGDVGIGTSSQEGLLHLSKSSAGAAGPILVIDNPAASTLNNEAQIAFLTDNGASVGGTSNARIKVINTNAGNGAVSFNVETWDGGSAATRMSIGGGNFVVTVG